MLEEIVLLMPLTLPAFEAVADLHWRRAATAVAGVVLLGLMVQLIGVAVYVTVNEWHRGAASAAVRAAYPFVLSESPIVVQLKDLLARQNLSPWLIRAFAQPGPALLNVKVMPMELVMPPFTALGPAYGMALYSIKAVLHGKGADVFEMIEENFPKL